MWRRERARAGGGGEAGPVLVRSAARHVYERTTAVVTPVAGGSHRSRPNMFTPPDPKRENSAATLASPARTLIHPIASRDSRTDDGTASARQQSDAVFTGGVRTQYEIRVPLLRR